MEAKTQILLWSHPECPNRVTIPAPLLNEIRILAVEAFYSVPRGGVEIGGVFFGLYQAETVQVRAFRPVRCEYVTGPSFTLSVKDQIGLSGVLDQVETDPELAGMTAVGWYHSHTRSEVFLSPSDLQLFREFFPERWQIALVLRPANLQPTRAGFFFRDRRGAIQSDSPVEELILEPPNFGLSVLDGEAEAALPEPEPLPKPTINTTPKPAPVISPMASIVAAAVAPAIAPPTAPEAVLAPLQAMETAAVQGEAPKPKLLQLTMQPTEQMTAEATDKSEPDEPLVSEPEADVALPTFLANAAPVKKRGFGWIWAVVALILLAGVGGAAVFKQWGKAGKVADLGLETYDINGAFLIRWDRDSSVVRGATRGQIEIQDGSDVTSIPLTRLDLTVGGFGYIRHTGQVSVRMTVEGTVRAEEYSNFNGTQALGSQTTPISPATSGIAKALADNEHLKTELINESMQTLELRRQIADLRRQLTEERAKNTSPPAQ